MSTYLEKYHPQIHLITNYITATDAVNAVLACGGVAIAGDSPKEAADITRQSDALVINTGTPSKDKLRAFLQAGRAANDMGIPVVLDPVGAGATAFRKKMLRKLLKTISFTCIRGNAAEIKTLSLLLTSGNRRQAPLHSLHGKDPAIKKHTLSRGVEAENISVSKAEILELSKKLNSMIVVTGENVILADYQNDYYEILLGGSYMQKRFTGAGCMMTAILGTNLGAALAYNRQIEASHKPEASHKAESRHKPEAGHELNSSHETTESGFKSKNTVSIPYIQAIRDAISIYESCARRAELICLKNKRFCTMTYKNTLIDELSISAKSHKKRFNSCDLLLYAITDQSFLSDDEDALEKAVEKAVRGGCTMIQLREKNKSFEEYFQIAIKIKRICDKFDVPLIINDNVRVCQESGAAGVHLGQDDENIAEARTILGDDFIIGATAHNLQEAQIAARQGADYLGVGAAFGSDTKKDAKPVPNLEIYGEITKEIDIPIVAIGGIDDNNMHLLKGSGISGIAVISSIFGSLDIENKAKRLKEKAKEEFLV